MLSEVISTANTQNCPVHNASNFVHSLNDRDYLGVSFNVAADVAFNQAQYSVQESESSLMVCAEISGVPAEGLECDVVVTFVLISNSTKAGMLPPK